MHWRVKTQPAAVADDDDADAATPLSMGASESTSKSTPSTPKHDTCDRSAVVPWVSHSDDEEEDEDEDDDLADGGAGGGGWRATNSAAHRSAAEYESTASRVRCSAACA